MKIDTSDIFSDGSIRLFRQRTDIPFKIDNTLCIEVPFANATDIPDVLAVTEAQERKLAARYPFAWDPTFGYVTSRPKVCGTGLQIHGLFHLEGLFIIGDLTPVLNGLKGMRLDVSAMDGEGIKQAAHVFRIHNESMIGLSTRDLAQRIQNAFEALILQEGQARQRLVEEMPLVLEDGIERALATLTHCRLLTQWELLDLLSPVTLAAEMGFLTGLTAAQAKRMIRDRLDLTEEPAPQSYDDERDRDRKDAALAAKANAFFKKVHLNARARNAFQS